MSGDSFLVDGIAFWRNEDWLADDEIEDGVIRVHLFREKGYRSLHRIRYGQPDRGRTDRQ